MENESNQYFKTITQIEEETGEKFIDIYNDLLKQGKSQSEIAMNLKLRGPYIISSYLNEYHHKQRERPNSKIRETLKEHNISFHFRNLEKVFPELFGLEYKDFLIKKYIDEKLSIRDLSYLLGTGIKTIRRHLKDYGISKSISTARKHAIENGKLNYSKINSKSRITRLNSKFNSVSQEYIHGVVQETLTKRLIEDDKENIEIITSLNEWSILKDKEVDIPIVIINNRKNTFKKYSIEFQGEYFHRNKIEADTEKELRLKKNGWKHFQLFYDTNFTKMHDEIDKIVNQIVNDFL
ncbi:hypothetical protein [Bacillus sp. S56]|uniref:hypothetical protein n=1 Tax=Bacillus sp. S56 TaxID=1226987 RepID=UPI00190C5396|nr:hypothetical protein [Bacillus sp. S56]MBK0072368.1 hypothetical protein [Bacillus sp. S56]